MSFQEVNVTFASSFHTVGEFINQALSQRRIVNLTEVKLESNDPTGKLGAVRANLTFRLYLKTPPVDAAK